MIYTADELLDSIKTRAMIPNSQNTFSDSDLLNLANEEMESFIAGTLLRVQEEYLVRTIEMDIVANQDHYRVPSRALGGKLRDIIYQETSIKARLPRISREEIPDYSVNPAQRPYCFYMEGNYVVILPGPTSTGNQLIMSYYSRPGRLVTSDSYAVVASFSALAKTITISGSVTPGNITVGSFIDIQNNLSGNENTLEGLTVASVAGSVITVVEDLTDPNSGLPLIAVGNYVTSAEQSAVPQCPEEMHPLLAQRVACRVLEALNDSEGLANASLKLKEMESNILALIDSRVTGKPLKIINRTGLLGSARTWSLKHMR